MVIPCRSPVSATSFFWVIPRISHAPRHKRVTGIAIFRLKVPPFEDAKAWLTSNRPDPSSFGLGSFGDFHHKNCEKTGGIMKYAWNINGIIMEYLWIPSGVIKHGLLESSPFSSMISQGTKPPRLGDFQWQRCRTYQILLHLESGHQPSAVHVATSLASQHCYVYRGTGVTPGYIKKKYTQEMWGRRSYFHLIFPCWIPSNAQRFLQKETNLGNAKTVHAERDYKSLPKAVRLRSRLAGLKYLQLCLKRIYHKIPWAASTPWKRKCHGSHRFAGNSNLPASQPLPLCLAVKFNPKCWDSLWMPQGHGRNQSGSNLRVGVKLRAELRPQCLGNARWDLEDMARWLRYGCGKPNHKPAPIKTCSWVQYTIVYPYSVWCKIRFSRSQFHGTVPIGSMYGIYIY